MRENIIYLTEQEAQLDIGALHIQQALSNISVGYQNGDFIAEQIAPVVPSNYLTDKYWKFGFEKFRQYNDNYIPEVTPGEIGWSLTQDSFTCGGHAVRGWYPSLAPSAADTVIDLDVETTEDVTDAILLAQEINLKTALVNGLSPTSLIAAGTPFDNAGFDPVPWFDMQKETIARAIGKKPNCLVLGRPAWRALRNNPNLLKHIATGSLSLDLAPNKMITTAQLAEQLEIPEVIVGEAMYDTAPLGESPNLQYIWDQYALLFYKDPAPGRRKVSLAWTFRWTGGANGNFVQKWYDQDKKRQVIDGMKFYAQKIIATGAALMWSNTVNAVDVPAGEV